MKKKIVKGWKVVSDRRNSACCTVSGVMLHYPVGQWIKPKLTDSKIMFFKDFNDASNFANLEGLTKIIPCLAVGVSKPKYISNDLWEIGRLKEFWQYRKNKMSLLKNHNIAREAPYGTYFADSIKCLE